MSPTLEEIFRLTATLARKVRRDISGKVENEAKLVITFWFAKAAKSLGAALALWNSGFWQDAAVIGRTVLEIALQARYLGERPNERASEFLGHIKAQQYKLFVGMKEHADDEIKRSIVEHLEKLTADSALSRNWKNWWGKDDSFLDLAKALEAEGVYRSQYVPLSYLVHSTPSALPYYVIADCEGLNIDWSAAVPNATIYQVAETFMAAAPAGLLDVINVLSRIWNFDYESDLQNLRGLLDKYNS